MVNKQYKVYNQNKENTNQYQSPDNFSYRENVINLESDNDLCITSENFSTSNHPQYFLQNNKENIFPRTFSQTFDNDQSKTMTIWQHSNTKLNPDELPLSFMKINPYWKQQEQKVQNEIISYFKFMKWSLLFTFCCIICSCIWWFYFSTLQGEIVSNKTVLVPPEREWIEKEFYETHDNLPIFFSTKKKWNSSETDTVDSNDVTTNAIIDEDLQDVIFVEEDEDLINLRKFQSPSSTTVSSMYEAKVSPTLPTVIVNKSNLTTDNLQFSPNHHLMDIEICESTSLDFCKSVLDYDLTTSQRKTKLSQLEREHYELLFKSKCSNRANEFVCSLLEPECRPSQMGILLPCKRICKAILKPCDNIIANSEILLKIFDCEQYPDSNDHNLCEDPTRRRSCFDDEFQCSDLSCIPKQWKCDNIKDCATGEDENDTECSYSKHTESILEQNDDEEKGSKLDIFAFKINVYKFDDHNSSIEQILTKELFEHSDDIELESGKDEIHPKNTNEGKSIVLDRNHIANFRDSKEIMMTSDSETNYRYSKINQTKHTEDPEVTTFKANLYCPDNKLRCVSGKCITVSQICDKKVDCPDGADEAMCVYGTS